MSEEHKMKIVQLQPDEPASPIRKPGAFSLDKFKTKPTNTIANVETLLTGLPHHKISEARDFVRLHPDEDNYWSPELSFVNVPIKGMKRDTLHLIEEELAMRYLPSARIPRFRLALATKPFDAFFLCHVPTRNEDNPYNATSIRACTQGQTYWVTVSSRKEEGIEAYKIDFARDQDAFPAPNWPTQSLTSLIEATFAGRIITSEMDPALLRLIGAKPLND
jgi:hypothetical protein